VQVDLGELLDDQVETVGLVELLDLASNPKYSMISRARELKLAMYCCRFWATLLGRRELGEVEAAGVVEGLLSVWLRMGSWFLTAPPLRLSHLASTSAWSVQGRSRGAQDGERQDDLAVLSGL